VHHVVEVFFVRRAVYITSLLAVQIFDVQSGAMHGVLRGHFDSINACVFNPSSGELYTAAADGNVVVWSPPQESVLPPECELELGTGAVGDSAQPDRAVTWQEDEDNWSD
jgi:DNA excision repair protein ERCC-8